MRGISAWPDALSFTFEDREYRFAWDNPLVISPHDPGVLYGAANVVFRSEDDGASWDVISPDLTRNDLEEPGEFDPLTDIATFERCAISRFAESPVTPGVFWAGSDDGLIHLSKDGGESWTNVTPDGFPEWSMVSSIDASHHHAGTAYVATTRYQHGDYRPYLYRTHDYGETWSPITGGISDVDFTRVMREDPKRVGGCCTRARRAGSTCPWTTGSRGAACRPTCPPVPIHDMVVKDDDLVVGTHGRAFWILDDVTPLHEMSGRVGESGAYLFRPRGHAPLPGRAESVRDAGAGAGQVLLALAGDACDLLHGRDAGGRARAALPGRRGESAGRRGGDLLPARAGPRARCGSSSWTAGATRSRPRPASRTTRLKCGCRRARAQTGTCGTCATRAACGCPTTGSRSARSRGRSRRRASTGCGSRPAASRRPRRSASCGTLGSPPRTPICTSSSIC